MAKGYTDYKEPITVWIREKPLGNGTVLLAYKCVLEGETTRSFVSTDGYKYSKADHDIFTEEEAENNNWVFMHRYAIGSAVDRVTDYAVLRQIADLIGWEPKP